MKKHLTISALMVGAGLVQAHEGHGLPGSLHWHADDALVLIALAALAALGATGLWLAKRK